MISSDTSTFDKTKWKETFQHGIDMDRGHCQQEFAPQFQIHKKTNNNNDNQTTTSTTTTSTPQTVVRTKDNAIVHCIEAMPITAHRLTETVQSLSWEH